MKRFLMNETCLNVEIDIKSNIVHTIMFEKTKVLSFLIARIPCFLSKFPSKTFYYAFCARMFWLIRLLISTKENYHI